MNNKEWIEIKLTKEQLELLENFNIITSHNAMYILGLGEFYKVEKGGKHYISTDVKLLPPTVLESYKWILERQIKIIAE